MIEIPFAEAVTGATKTIRIKRLITCDRCSGSGAEKDSTIITCAECGGTGQVTRVAQSFFGSIQQRAVCPRCKGSGKIPEKPCGKCSGEGRVSGSVDVPISIPAGIDDGQTLRVRGEGDAGRQGKEAGDLYVGIRVTPDPRFEREGETIRSTITIPLLDALLGADVPLETVHGKVTFTIPEGTQPDQVFRIKGKGFPILSSSRTGDHYVTVKVEIPRKLSRAERKVVEEWRSLR